jgi:hypothetical protein
MYLQKVISKKSYLLTKYVTSLRSEKDFWHRKRLLESDPCLTMNMLCTYG